jgi:hypothetical protein
MGSKLDKNEIVSFKEVLVSNAYTQEAIINILERKGLLSREEVLEEILELRKKQK